MAVITRDLRLEGGALIRNLVSPVCTALGFTPRACRPYRAQTKGKVEQPVRYLRSNIVYGRTFLHNAGLEAQRRLWLEAVANVRMHGTIGERPRDRFNREERLQLQPLAARPYTSLVLAPTAVPSRRPLRAAVEVQKRSLAEYAQLAGGAA